MSATAPTRPPADYAALVAKAKALGRPLVLSCTDLEAAKAGVEAASGVPFILNGATADNYADMSALAKGAKALLGVRAESLEALHQVVEKLEAAGNKDLILDVGEGLHQGRLRQRRPDPPGRPEGRRPHLRLSLHRQRGRAWPAATPTWRPPC